MPKTWAGPDGKPLPVRTDSRFAHGLSQGAFQQIVGLLEWPKFPTPPDE